MNTSPKIRHKTWVVQIHRKRVTMHENLEGFDTLTFREIEHSAPDHRLWKTLAHSFRTVCVNFVLVEAYLSLMHVFIYIRHLHLLLSLKFSIELSLPFSLPLSFPPFLLRVSFSVVGNNTSTHMAPCPNHQRSRISSIWSVVFRALADIELFATDWQLSIFSVLGLCCCVSMCVCVPFGMMCSTDK